MQKKECVHSMTRRARNHDYTRGFYHIILLKNPDVAVPYFGCVLGDPDLLSCMGNSAYAKLTPLGLIIYQQIAALKKSYPQLVIYANCIMPDHLHLAIQLKAGLSIHLWEIIAAFKVRCTQAAALRSDGREELISVFKDKFTDRIIYNQRQLAAEISYVLDNPRRRAMLSKYPDYFRRCSRLQIGDIVFNGFGNRFLSDHPMRFAIRVRSAWSDDEFKIYLDRCRMLTEQGGIGVSPFISPREKKIRDVIIGMGGKIIIMRKENMSERFKPAGREFELCTEGRLLLLCEASAPEYRPTLKRAEALRLNELCHMLETHHIPEPL